MLLYKTNAHRCIGLWSLQMCVSSLLNVSVLLLLELDFKRIYFIHTGADRHVMSVLRLPQEDVAIFRFFFFLLLNEELPDDNQIPLDVVAPQSRLNVQ